MGARGKAGTVFIYLSKAFDYVEHDLLIAKLHAYGFDHDDQQVSVVFAYGVNTKSTMNFNTILCF